MRVKPLGLRVAIKPHVKKEDKTSGGIIIPDKAQKEPPTGDVIAIGNSTDEEDMIIDVGDVVLYGRILSEIEDGDEKIFLLNQQDIIAKVYED